MICNMWLCWGWGKAWKPWTIECQSASHEQTFHSVRTVKMTKPQEPNEKSMEKSHSEGELSCHETCYGTCRSGPNWEVPRCRSVYLGADATQVPLRNCNWSQVTSATVSTATCSQTTVRNRGSTAKSRTFQPLKEHKSKNTDCPKLSTKHKRFRWAFGYIWRISFTCQVHHFTALREAFGWSPGISTVAARIGMVPASTMDKMLS